MATVTPYENDNWNMFIHFNDLCKPWKEIPTQNIRVQNEVIDTNTTNDLFGIQVFENLKSLHVCIDGNIIGNILILLSLYNVKIALKT